MIDCIYENFRMSMLLFFKLDFLFSVVRCCLDFWSAFEITNSGYVFELCIKKHNILRETVSLNFMKARYFVEDMSLLFPVGSMSTCILIMHYVATAVAGEIFEYSASKCHVKVDLSS